MEEESVNVIQRIDLFSPFYVDSLKNSNVLKPSPPVSTPSTPPSFQHQTCLIWLLLDQKTSPQEPHPSSVCERTVRPVKENSRTPAQIPVTLALTRHPRAKKLAGNMLKHHPRPAKQLPTRVPPFCAPQRFADARSQQPLAGNPPPSPPTPAPRAQQNPGDHVGQI